MDERRVQRQEESMPTLIKGFGPGTWIIVLIVVLLTLLAGVLYIGQ